MTLEDRDRAERGGAGVLCTAPGEALLERWRGANVWDLGGRKRRCGCTIGPHNFDTTGCWTPDAPHHREQGGLDLWQPIDLKFGGSARSGVALTMHRCGYEVDLDDALSVTFRRGGPEDWAQATMLPLGLGWAYPDGRLDMIAEPRPGRPMVADEDGVTVRDAFGQGIHWRVSLWPDMCRPCIVIDDPQWLLHNPLTRPENEHAKLVKVLSVGWYRGNPDRDGLFGRHYAYKQRCGDRLVIGRPDERAVPTAPVAMQCGLGDALWFQAPRAWDAEASYPMTAEWQRHGPYVTMLCGLDVADVARAGAGLCLDTTMSEQVVASNNDDSHERGDGTFWLSSYVRVYSNPTTTSSLYRCGGFRWASCPLPAGSAVSDATIAAYVYDTGFDDVDTVVYLDTSSSSPDFATLASIINPANRPRTTASASWSATSTGTGFQTISGVGPALQERLGAGSWTSGDPLTALLIAGTGTTRTVMLHGYDTSAANAAKLNATYTEPAGGLSPAVVAAHFAMMRRRSY